jgi:hypothetical protein
MNKKCEKIYTPSTPGHLLETKSFSPSVLPSGDVIALAINENFSELFSIFRLSPLG